MKIKRIIGIIGVLTAVALVLAGCNALPISSNSGAIISTGTLVLNLTDAPAKPDITKVEVTIDRLQVHLAENAVLPPTTETTTTTTTTETTTATTTEIDEVTNGWQTLPLTGGVSSITVDLLTLQGGVLAGLTTATLAEGKYTQIRMDVSKVMVTESGKAPVEAKLPSGTLKFVHTFEIVAGQETAITFDFDALKSIVATGNGKFICKPVIQLNTAKQPKAEDLKITTNANLPDGTVGTIYASTSLAAIGGTSPYIWGLAAGSALPPGLNLSTAGVVTGTPTVFDTPPAVKVFTFTVQVSDSVTPTANTATKVFNIKVNAAATP